MYDQEILCRALSTTSNVVIESSEVIQELWSGYGRIIRYRLSGAKCDSVIIKSISPPEVSQHPRGWNTSLSHQRKLQSYEVEFQWYRDWSGRCDSHCRVPQVLSIDKTPNRTLIIMEDLDVAGFPRRYESVSRTQVNACITWLAEFHATFLGASPTGLWETGTYWHLATRPDEWNLLDDQRLKEAAPKIDTLLSSAQYQTIVHGDAKLANFCFSSSGERVAAVDFQYAGGGCGMKDLAYFIGSCLNEEQADAEEDSLLDYYFAVLMNALERRGSVHVASNIEDDWRPLYRVAWADFHRFLKGWSPGHWKINAYSDRVLSDVLDSIS